MFICTNLILLSLTYVSLYFVIIDLHSLVKPPEIRNYQENTSLLKGIFLSKALTCVKLLLYKQNCFSIKETDIFGHIVV